MSFAITHSAIDLARLRSAVTDPASGACVVFEGWVRNHHEGRAVLRLEYEVYEPVAVNEGARIIAEAAECFGPLHAAAVHRAGLLELGELYAEQGKFASGRAVLKRAVELDDFYEPAIQALMRLYALDQQPRLALDAYHQFGQRLRQIGALPEPETQSLYLSIQTSF